MFKHILLPTDGSPLSQAAARKCVLFAKSIGASITGFQAIPPFRMLPYAAEVPVDPEANLQREYEEAAHAYARQSLAQIEEAAASGGVACDTLSVVATHPYEAIVRAAEENGCDLIVMASHGRKGVQALMIGSETVRVLTHTTLPVLVFR